jgi:hypothetical protein
MENSFGVIEQEEQFSMVEDEHMKTPYIDLFFPFIIS